MTLRVAPLSPEGLAEMLTWRYEPPYDFYDGDGDPPQNPERYLEARDDAGRFVGFYYFELRGDTLEYGLGLAPDLTGTGLGLEFFRRGLAEGRGRFGPARIVLDVAAFNDRARIVYERAGFRVTGRHVRRFDRWGEVPFLQMEAAT